MADSTLSNLTQIATIATDDRLYIEDASEAAPADQPKRLLVSQLDARFATAAQGAKADNSLWMTLVRGYKTTPTLTQTIASGDVYTYTYNGSAGDVAYYRLVPSGAEPDAFYSTFSSGVLSGEIARKAITL